jgi:hypothetical protein
MSQKRTVNRLVGRLGNFTSGRSSSKPRAVVEFDYDSGSDQDSNKVSQAELQQDLQRFSTVFFDRVAQGLDEIRKSKSPAAREEGLKRALLYGTSALDIATEHDPEVGLLDMIVFILLNRDALEQHWIPEHFKDEGKGLLLAFERSESEIWSISEKVLTADQQKQLKNLIARWKFENPGQVRVEGVRLGDFSKKAGRNASERAKDAHGLLSSVASGVEAADDALLLAERMVFMAQRLPFLLRMHASLSSGEIITSVASKFESAEKLEGALQETRSITELAGDAAREGRMLVEALQPMVLPMQSQLRENLLTVNDIASKAVTLSEQINAANLITRVFAGLVLVNLGAATVWWSGYYLAKRKLIKAA